MEITDFVLKELCSLGNQVVITSRPEGIDMARFEKSFVVLTIEPLSREQAHKVISRQLQNEASIFCRSFKLSFLLVKEARI